MDSPSRYVAKERHSGNNWEKLEIYFTESSRHINHFPSNYWFLLAVGDKVNASDNKFVKSWSRDPLTPLAVPFGVDPWFSLGDLVLTKPLAGLSGERLRLWLFVSLWKAGLALFAWTDKFWPFRGFKHSPKRSASALEKTGVLFVDGELTPV